MNTSFRTAFWAMCLGLTVPMVLFVGVELSSGGGRAAKKAALSAADDRGSLRAHWEQAESKSADARRGAAGHGAALRAEKTRDAAGAKNPPIATKGQSTPAPNTTDPAEAKVVLGPQLEPDQAAVDGEGGRDPRVGALASHARPKVHVLPDPDELPAALEVRLAGIQQHLDKIGRAIAAQTDHEEPNDRLKQATDLLRQLREARELEKLATETIELAEPKSGEQGPDGDHAPSLPLDDASPPEPSKSPEAANGPSTTGNSAKNDAADHKKRPRAVTKIYRPQYLSGSALESLVEPLLTNDIGKAGAADAAIDESAAGAYGDSSPAPRNTLVVHDFPDVLRKVELLIDELDIPPQKVIIEATVLTVRLSGGMPHGIDLAEFNAPGQPFAVTGIGNEPVGKVSPKRRAPSLLSQPGTQFTHGFGLKCGVLSGDPQAFIGVLEAAMQSRPASSWQMTVLNQQSGELMLTDSFGPSGANGQSAAGTILKIRPIVTRDGIVSLDVRREVDLDSASGTRSAALTNQFSLQEGQTAVLAGFFAEHAMTQLYRTSGIGQIPFVGRLFHKQACVVERSETVVLLTPHVVRSDAASESGHAVLSTRPARQPKIQAASKSKQEVAVPERKAVEQAVMIESGDPANLTPQRPSPVESAAPAAPRKLSKKGTRPARSAIAPSAKDATEEAELSIPELTLPSESKKQPEIRPARTAP